MPKFHQGKFAPHHPEKYKGNLAKITYRSSWELSFMKFLDNNPNVLEWASEEIIIPYVKPTDGKIHRYFPDFYMRYKQKDGQVKQTIIEIKPKNQTMRSRKRKGKYKLYEDIQYAVNIAKWQAAQQFCKHHHIEFKILTEQDLFK